MQALAGPVEIDDSPKPFSCPVDGCGCRYVRKGDLKVHFLKKHKEHEANFPDLLRSKVHRCLFLPLPLPPENSSLDDSSPNRQ